MAHHTFDASGADRLEDAAARFRHVSADELRWALALDGDERVADLGSGTGFYTDLVAPDADVVYAVDVQPEMQDYYREKGVPENVELVTADVAGLPVADLDAAFSTMTYHEFATDEALDRLADALVSGARLVVADWSAEGEGEHGPPRDERYAAADAVEALESRGFDVEFVAERPETFFLVADR